MNNNQQNTSLPTSITSGQYRLLLGVAVVIALLVFFGLLNFVETEQILFLLPMIIFSLPFVLPAILLIGVFIYVAQRFGTQAYVREGVPLRSFAFGTALYILQVFAAIVIANFILVQNARLAPQDMQFATGLLSSASLTLSFFIAYIGLLICMRKLLASIKKNTTHTEYTSSHALFQYVVVGIVIILSLYVFGVAAPIAKITQSEPLCSLVYKNSKKADCVSNIARTETVLQNQFFRTESTPYSKIMSMQNILGKLAYRFQERGSNKVKLMFDGRVIDDDVRWVNEVDGDLVYASSKNGQINNSKNTIKWRGEEYGAEYYSVSSPVYINGALAFIANKGELPNSKARYTTEYSYVVVWNGVEYDEGYSHIKNLQDINGQLSYVGSVPESVGRHSYVHIGSKKYGPYLNRTILEFNNKRVLIKRVVSEGERYIIDGIEQTICNNIQNYTITDKGFAPVCRGGDIFAIFENGTKVGEFDSKIELLPNINGKLAFIGTKNGITKLYIDGKTTGSPLGDFKYVYVSENGKVATISQEDPDWIVRIDNNEVFRGDVNTTFTSNFGFYGERFLFQINKDEASALWYDGQIVGRGFYRYEPILIDGKLIIAAEAMSKGSSESEYSLFFEK
jgi:hypothetical protein